MKRLAAPKTFAIVGKHTGTIAKMFLKKGFKQSQTPDFVVSYGGDGTVLYTELKHPGVPKLCVRSRKGCAKCTVRHVKTIELPEHEAVFYCLNCVSDAIEAIASGKATVRDEPKLLGTVHYKRQGNWREQAQVALNEIQVHNKNPTHAIRCSVKIESRNTAPVFVGDGVIVATPFGASGYFNAVTRHVFRKGFGIAFNNGIYHRAPVFLDDLRGKIKIEVLRRRGLFIADNFASTITMLEGDYVTIEKAKQPARFIVT